MPRKRFVWRVPQKAKLSNTPLQSPYDGADVGAADGASVGNAVGYRVGNADGAAVGEKVHALQWPGHVLAIAPVASAHPPPNAIKLGQMPGSGPSGHEGAAVGAAVGE